MQAVYFKMDSSRPIGFETLDGRIDYFQLGQEFELDPSFIKLNGIRFAKQKLKSAST